jgi:hypothetical protein
VTSLSLATVAISLGLALLAALAGGGLGGVAIGGKDLGVQLAGAIGAFFGAVTGMLGVGLGFVLLLVIG